MKKTSKRSTVVGVFQDNAHAQKAVRALKEAGFTEDQIGVVGPHTEGKKAAAGAATGAVAGAGIAALWSLAITFGVLPVIGPILAAGPLAAALISAAGGAAVGGIVGALIGLGIPEHEAKYYQGEVEAGRTLVTVNANGRYDEAWRILHGSGAYNYETAATARAAGQKLEVHEEELHARKRPVEKGEVRVRKEVHTEHRTLDVPVEHEEVVVERRPGSGRAASRDDIRGGEEIRIPVKEEEVQVEKESVIKEDVTVGKRKVRDTEHVGGTVREEEVHVEQKGDVKVRDSGTPKKETGRGRNKR
jgi:uncharacterized protein (TIGR02271 family)